MEVQVLMKTKALFTVTMLILVMAAPSFAQSQADIQAHARCTYCNMDRQQFAFSRMLINYDDGTVTPTCSIHCAAVDLSEKIDKTPREIKVADFQSKSLIDAETAIWVVGGNKPGVMTKRAKWAFEKKEDAEKFVQENGGTIASLDDAMKATYEDMYADTKMIREKRKMKMKSEKKE
jgi:nitrous oxide reductase accessory protein NosL